MGFCLASLNPAAALANARALVQKMAAKVADKANEKAKAVANTVEKTAVAAKQFVQDKVIPAAQQAAAKVAAAKQAIQTKTAQQVKKAVVAVKKIASTAKKVADDKVWCPLKGAWVNTDKAAALGTLGDSSGYASEAFGFASTVFDKLSDIRKVSALARLAKTTPYFVEKLGKNLDKVSKAFSFVGVAAVMAEKGARNWEQIKNGTGRDRAAAAVKVFAAGAISIGISKLASFAGAKAGAFVGAKLGATIGSFIPIPGVGTLVGAIVGVAVGLAVGYAVGELYKNYAEKPLDQFIDRKIAPPKQPTRGP